ncbi:hypothetical protein Tco_0556336 [Tanacetum coccineum]
MVGSLMYLTGSRPDLVFVVCMCARYQASPTKKYLEALKWVFWYLRGTINWGIWYPKDIAMTLMAYAHADHAGCQDTRRSTSRSAKFFGDKLVSWSSIGNKKACVLNTEAEYIACLDVVLLLFAAIMSSTPSFADIFTSFITKRAVLLSRLGMKSMNPETLKDKMADENVPLLLPTDLMYPILPFAALGSYIFELDETRFILDANLLRETLEITPIDQAHQFVSPPSGDAIMDFVNELSPTKKGRKDKPHVIPYCRFTKLIICYLGRIHNIHQRSSSPFHLAEEDLRLSNLKFVSKGEVDEVFGMPIPNELILNNIRNALYYNAYLEMVANHDQKNAETSAESDKTNNGGDIEILQITKELGEDVDKQVNLKQKTVELDQDKARSDPGETHESRPSSRAGINGEERLGTGHGESVLESLKFLADEHVILEDPLSSTMTLSLMKNLEDAYTIGDPFINDKSTKDEPRKLNVEAEVISMVTVPIYQASSLVPPLRRTRISITRLRILDPSTSKKQSGPHLEQPVEDIPMPDTTTISDSEDTDSTHLLKIKPTSEWLKPIPEEDRPETPKPNWSVPTNDMLEPENNWANAFVKSYKDLEENKLLRKTDRRVSPNAYDQVDLVNPEGHRLIPNVSKPLPLGGPLGQVTIQSQFFFNKDLELLFCVSAQKAEKGLAVVPYWS